MIKSKGGWPASGAIQPLPTGLAKVSIHPTETFELVFAKVRKGATPAGSAVRHQRLKCADSGHSNAGR